ncbi:MAG TPA: response regulator [Pyrinomonadaceae bacterium]
MSVLKESHPVLPDTKARPTILVVDDSRLIRLLLKTVLMDDGYCVLEAENGMEAYEIASGSKSPDLIIIDFSMPGMDGSEAIRKIRAECRHCHHVPILMLSASGPIQREAALNAGANAYFSKPDEFEQLLSTVRNILGEGVSDI